MKKIIIAVLSIFISTTSLASVFSMSSLPTRCNEISVKLETIEKDQSSDTCIMKVQGYAFQAAGMMISQHFDDQAKMYLDMGISELKIAKELGCNGLPVIDWAISEAKSIKQAI